MSNLLLYRLIPLGSTVIVYFVVMVLGELIFGVENHYLGEPFEFWSLYYPVINFNASLLPDFAAQIVLAYILFFILRSTTVFILVQLLIVGFLYFGCALHISFFGEPPSAHDMFSIGSLFEILSLLEKLAIALPVVTLILLFVVYIKKSKLPIALFITVFWGIPGFTVANAAAIKVGLSGLYPHKAWDKKFNYDARGGSIYIYDEVVRYLVGREDIPEAEVVAGSTKRLLGRPDQQTVMELPGQPLRNVHLIIVEASLGCRTVDKCSLYRGSF